MLSIYLDTATFDSDDYFAGEVRQYLEFFHTKVQEGTTVKEMPVHDETSHSAAAAGTFFEAHCRGMLEGSSGVALESRRRSGRGVRVITGRSSRSAWS